MIDLKTKGLKNACMIKTILGLKHVKNRRSCLLMAIRSARYLTGRNVVTGKALGICEMEYNVLKKDDVTMHQLYNEHFFSGLAMYLIAIDCIGCLFENSTITSKIENNSIIRALKSFSSLDNERIEAVKDLRNTLAHNFGLATESKGGAKKTKHKFTLSFSDKAEAIKLPKKDWDGDFGNKKQSCSTIIGVSAFCNLAESIIANVYDSYEKGLLKLRVSEEQVKARFTVLV